MGNTSPAGRAETQSWIAEGSEGFAVASFLAGRLLSPHAEGSLTVVSVWNVEFAALHKSLHGLCEIMLPTGVQQPCKGLISRGIWNSNDWL